MTETLTVRELCNAVGTAVDATFPDEVWVKGAISGLNRSQSGHVYFNLIEPTDSIGDATDGVLPVALFEASKHRVNAILRKSGNVRMHDGVEIRARGRVRYYPPQGRIQLVMSLIDPAYTIGRMAVARDVLLAELRAEGILHANQAVAMPALPVRVGLVTSNRSAAHADFVHELDSSRYRFEVTLFDSRVQGIDAVPSLVDGIRAADRSDVDVVVVIRGGGARTDLAAFDNERVARAIAGCGRPVVVGVGHEIDRSVADEVAHTSTKTPTATAAWLIDRVRRFDDETERALRRLANLAAGRVDTATGHLDATAARLANAAGHSIDHRVRAVDSRVVRLRHRTERALDRAEHALDQASLRLQGLDPARVLARGYSITHTADGTLVKDVGQVGVGTELVTSLSAGKLTSTVTDLATTDPSGSADGVTPTDDLKSGAQ